MALGDIPTGIGFPTVIRIILPGIISSILLTYIVDPCYSSSSLTNTFSFWIVTGIIIGMILWSIDLYIYQFFEGIRFWRRDIWWWQYRRILNYRRKLYNNITTKISAITLSENKEEIKNLSINIKSLSDRLREYPNDPQNIEATRLGNVLADYETYSSEQYGMSFNVFWGRIWLILPQELRDEIKLRSAEADFPVYISFIFFLGSFLVGLRLISLKNDVYMLINQTFRLSGMGQFFAFLGIVLIAVCIFLCISRIFYIISISAHKKYGKYVKSIIDIYRIEYAKKIGINSSIIPTEGEKKKWADYGKFLQDYDTIDHQ
jgi:hypothetical protein